MRVSLYFSIGKGLPFRYIGKRRNPQLTRNERPRTVRRKKADLHARVNDNLKMEFTGEGLTSYAGLELLMRYLRNVDWNRQLRRHLGGVGFGGDFGVVSLCRVLLGLLWVGGRRLRHLDFLKGDPLLQRFCGLTDLPTPRSMSTFLRRFTDKGLNALKALNADVVAHKINLLCARKLTIDVDGTVLCTGKRVGGARRGYNPHHRKVPSYYPITAYLADSGHFLGVHNRPGNVNDGSASIGFLKDVFSQIKETLGHAYTLRFRMDGDFFKEDLVNTLIKNKASYAIKVPFWKGLCLQHKIRQCSNWQRIEKGVDGFTSTLTVKKWKRTLNIAIFRKRVMHQTRKNYQLDLLIPMTAPSNTVRWPPIYPSSCARSGASWQGAACTRKPSANSRPDSASIPSPHTITTPIVPGNSSSFSRTTSWSTSKSKPDSQNAIAPRKIPTDGPSNPYVHSGSNSSTVPDTSCDPKGVLPCASNATGTPKNTTVKSAMRFRMPPDLFHIEVNPYTSVDRKLRQGSQAAQMPFWPLRRFTEKPAPCRRARFFLVLFLTRIRKRT